MINIETLTNTPLVLVIWEDISSENLGWFSLEDIPNLETAYAYTPGWVVHVNENKNILHMIQALATHKGNLSPSVDLSIPIGCIQSISKLRTKWQYQPKTSQSKKTLTASHLKIYLPNQKEVGH